MENMAFIILACFVIFLSVCWITSQYKRKYRLPPGPRGVPGFGNLLQLNMKKLALDISAIGNDFDEAFTVKLFNQKCVILKSYEIIREAMVSEKYAKAFSGRPCTFIGEYVLPKDLVFQTYSVEWVAVRKSVFQGLKMYGSHLREVEDLVTEELKHLMSRIQNETGKSVDPCDYINGYVISILSMLLTGQHFKHDDPLLQLCGQLASNMDMIAGPGPTALLTPLPWLRHIPFGYGKLYKQIKRELAMFDQAVNERRKDRTQRNACFLDFLLDEKTKGNVDNESFSSIFHELLAAGTLTTQSTMYALLLILTARPDLQEKVQMEIDKEVGRSRLPCIEDKGRLPFTQAVLLEALRQYPAVPLAIPRCTLEDVEIRNFFLPKDTVVFYSVFDVHHDKTFWKDPWTFNPCRFLDDEGNLLPPTDQKRQRTIAFGLGKRYCVGETLARLRLLLALAAILQEFNLLPDPEFPLPDTDPRTFDCHIVLHAPRYKIVFQPRAS